MNDTTYDDNNPSHLRERADALDAKAEGIEIQVLHCDGNWGKRNIYCDKNKFDTCTRYRRAPAPKTRDWNGPEDVPSPCWIRVKGVDGCNLITGIYKGYIGFGETFLVWSDLKGREHSTDRKTWLPCTVIEP